MRDAHYWIQRLQHDCKRLTDEQKVELVRTLLTYVIPLDPTDAEFFVKACPERAEDLTRYAVIERKVAEAWSARENLFPHSSLRRKFLSAFRRSLRSLYTARELEEITSYMADGGESLAVMWLVGDHHSYRRIRNAYLSEITDVISNGREVILFDVPGDAVHQIETILGIKPKKRNS